MGYRFNNTFAKVFDAFYAALNLTRNLLICVINAANFNLCLPKFILPFFATSYMGAFLKFDWVRAAY